MKVTTAKYIPTFYDALSLFFLAFLMSCINKAASIHVGSCS